MMVSQRRKPIALFPHIYQPRFMTQLEIPNTSTTASRIIQAQRYHEPDLDGVAKRIDVHKKTGICAWIFPDRSAILHNPVADCWCEVSDAMVDWMVLDTTTH